MNGGGCMISVDENEKRNEKHRYYWDEVGTFKSLLTLTTQPECRLLVELYITAYTPDTLVYYFKNVSGSICL